MNRVEIETSVGYALKVAQHALRTAMDEALREHDLSVPQYACLELMANRPGLSNAALARGGFVTRQAMHQMLAGLRNARLVTSEGSGRQERFGLTVEGTTRLRRASATVAAVEERMLAPLDATRRRRLHGDLLACAEALYPIREAAVSSAGA